MAGNDERVEGIPHFDIHITDKNLDVSARTLISHIKKGWKIDKLQQKIFDDGISNKLVGYYVRPEHTKDGFINKTDNRSDIVLLRIYGAKTELFIDRAKELRNFQLLRKNGLSPRLYSTFENGYCYAFVEGRVLGPDDVRQEDMLERCAKLFARVHAVKIDQEYLHHHKMEANMFDGVKKLLRLLPAKFDDPEQQSRYNRSLSRISFSAPPPTRCNLRLPPCHQSGSPAFLSLIGLDRVLWYIYTPLPISIILSVIHTGIHVQYWRHLLDGSR